VFCWTAFLIPEIKSFCLYPNRCKRNWYQSLLPVPVSPGYRKRFIGHQQSSLAVINTTPGGYWVMCRKVSFWHPVSGFHLYLHVKQTYNACYADNKEDASDDIFSACKNSVHAEFLKKILCVIKRRISVVIPLKITFNKVVKKP